MSVNTSDKALTGHMLYMRLLEAGDGHQPLATLRFLRGVLEQLFRHLTRNEARSFSNLFARMQFYFDKHGVAAEQRRQLTILRILTTKAMTGGLRADQDDALLCIHTLANIIEAYYEVPQPEALLERCAAVAGQTLAQGPVDNNPLVPLLKCLVTGVGPLQKTPDGVESFVLQGKDDEAGEFLININSVYQPHTSALHRQLRVYDTLHILHADLHAGTGQYEAVKATRFILEPDLLIDISDLAECFGRSGPNPYLYLVRKLVPQSTGLPAFKGNIVNSLLDNVLRHPEMKLRESFVEAVAENVLQAAGYGRQELNSMYADIRETHWPNLLEASRELKDRPVRIEPTFFSALYGLQGRLDILAEDDTDPTRKEIFELKSGKAPDYGAWKNHEMQVTGYNLLLQSTFGDERCGSSAILYSSASNSPLRNVTNNRPAENELLALRNEIVAQLLRLSAGEYDILEQITPLAAEGLPSFSVVHFARFEETYSKASPLLRTYYQQFLSFLLREFLLAKCGMYASMHREEDAEGFAALWLQPESEKLSRFTIIPGLCFQHFDEAQSSVVFSIQEPVNHNFRPGDTAIIYPRDTTGLAPLQHQILKGRVDELQKDRLTFSLNNRQITHDFFAHRQQWVIEHDIYESNFWISATALFHVLEPRFADRMELLLGMREPVKVPFPIPAPTMFNSNQQEILQAALDAKDYYLVQGPPGTGKTSSLLTAMVTSLAAAGTQMMIVAFTNKAVDEICKKLDGKGVQYLRLGGRRSAAENQLRTYCLEGDIAQAREYIANQQIFVATVATMATRLPNLQLLGVKTDTLIVDEASQLTEPQLLGLVLPFQKFILIGDQNQLPPVVAQADNFCLTESTLLHSTGISDLRCTLFERLIQACKQNGWHHGWGMLNTHFRMHNDIADLINHYYAHQLSPGQPLQAAPFVRQDIGDGKWSRILSKGRTIFLPSPMEPTSKMHKTEAEQVVSLLTYLKESRGAAFNTETVGVVTPWRTQISLIRELIGADEELQAINIDTAERFQGAENDIIIISLAVYHPTQLNMLQSLGTFRWEEHTIEVDRKLLVTLSRARQQVILMGYEPALRSSLHYGKILDKIGGQ
ncbi:DEAD/DEAH box helicase [Chitinophaga silvisoli]|uniref:ATP-dependent helicase n=1 Tax=Chitinophaga silvisoli TaxID=2291814 RepID=A0A3E1P5P0_9BACT|nr:AAA domain-containing protein [Chitinophaga silvisoli]RFM35492.1 ATP-dependent helicase [Chitinophaga silvisoli]